MGRRRALGGVSKVVAVKLPTGPLADDAKLRALFIKEAELSMLLSHSTVVQVFDAGEDDGRPFMVMEWVDGLDLAGLKELLAREGRGFPLPVAAFVIGEVLRALAYAHTVTHEGAPLGVVHRDVSPQNVLISVSGEVKLTDFGVARVAREDTSGMHVKGKLRYMAPEQLEGESRAATVDLYAVGAMLHELMEGKKFRPSKSEAHLMGVVLKGEVPKLSDPDVPRELDAVRRGLLQKEVGQRISSAERALEMLMRWPGYGNASLELGRLCRSVMGVSAPRSSIHPTPGTALPSQDSGSGTAPPTSAAQLSAAATRLDPSSVPTLTAARGPAAHEDPRAALTATVAARRPRGSAGHARALSGPDAERRGRILAVAAFGGLVGVGALALLGSRALGFWGVAASGDAEREDLSASADIDAAVPAEAAAVPVLGGSASSSADPADLETPQSPGPPSLETGAALDATSPDAIAAAGEGTDGATEPESGSQVEPDGEDPGAKPEPRAKVARAKVTFKASQFDFVYVKVRGKVLTLEPNASAKLPAGRHPLYLRTRKDAPWKRAGVLELGGDEQYEVRMTRPGGFSVERKR